MIIFLQSEHIEEILTNKLSVEKRLLSLVMHIIEWKYGINKNRKVKNIGIALTNEFIMKISIQKYYGRLLQIRSWH